MIERQWKEKTAVNLDWFRYVQKWPIAWLGELRPDNLEGAAKMASTIATMPINAFKVKERVERPLHWYTDVFRLNNGLMAFNHQRPEMGIMIELGGTDLSNLRQTLVADQELIEFCIESGARPARIDVALDYYGAGNPTDLRKAFDKGKAKTRIRECTVVEKRDKWGNDRGTTVYFGNPTSNKRLRVYNKAAEMELPGEWLRVEYVGKAEAAMVATSTLNHVDKAIGARSLMKTLADFPTVEWWNRAMDGEVVEIEPIRRKDTDTKKWLLEQVAPAFKKEITEAAGVGDYEVLETYVEIIDSVVETNLALKQLKMRT